MRTIFFLVAAVIAVIVGSQILDELKKPPFAHDGPMRIIATPLVLDSDNPGRTELGELYFLGAWDLNGPDRSFGGLSSMAIMPDGHIMALSDSAIMFSFAQPGGKEMGQVKRLPTMKSKKYGWLPGTTDSESMVVDAAAGKVWAGFEMRQMICRYPLDLSRAEACRTWPQMKDWIGTSSIESMARLKDGRFLIIAEGAYGTNEGRDVLLFAGDPADAKTRAPTLMHYTPPVGYDPTDAVAISKDRLLVLNRRATIAQGFTAIITLVDISELKAGKMLYGREVARLVPPVLADNFEGLALENGAGGQKILWVVADDNHLFFERSLLLKFVLPDTFR